MFIFKFAKYIFQYFTNVFSPYSHCDAILYYGIRCMILMFVCFFSPLMPSMSMIVLMVNMYGVAVFVFYAPTVEANFLFEDK